MSKGGKEQTTTQSLPDWQVPYIQQGLEKAPNLLVPRQYQPYGAAPTQEYAGLSGQTKNMMGMANNATAQGYGLASGMGQFSQNVSAGGLGRYNAEAVGSGGTVGSGGPVQTSALGYGPATQTSAISAGGSPAAGLVNQQLNGDYLNSNPHLQQAISNAQQPMVENYQKATAPGIDSTWAMSGRAGSGGHFNATETAQGQLADSLGRVSQDMTNANYQNERAIQQGSIGQQYNDLQTTQGLNFAGQQHASDQNFAGGLAAQGMNFQGATNAQNLDFQGRTNAQNLNFQGQMAAQGLNAQSFDADMQRRMQAAGMTPQAIAAMGQSLQPGQWAGATADQSGQDYANANYLKRAAGYQNLRDQYDFRQNTGYDQLQKYMGIVGGGGWGSTQSTPLTKNVGSGVIGGALAGASLGSAIPVVGPGIGAIAGGLLGGFG